MKKILMCIPALVLAALLYVVVQQELSTANQIPQEEPQSAQTYQTPVIVQPDAGLNSGNHDAETIDTNAGRPAPQKTALPLDLENSSDYPAFFLHIADESSMNHELQEYTPEQVHQDGNTFQFTADQLDGKYVSGKVESMFGFLYGSITFRVTNINNPGLFPAIWMLPAQSGLYPELDIYEQLGREPQNFYGVSHFLTGPSAELDHYRTYFKYSFPMPEQIPESYTITFDWQPNAMSWYLDGEPVYTMAEHVPQMPMYLIINLAVGGIWSGDPTEDTVLPCTWTVEVLDFQPQEIYTR